MIKKITNSLGTNISDLSSWEDAFVEVDTSEHWKEGRSAYCLAKHFTDGGISNSSGVKKLNELLLSFGYSNIEIEDAEIEHESRFDKFRGKGRMQDMLLHAKSKGKRLAICIEAKVDETFDKPVSVAYKDAEAYIKKGHDNSNRIKRIEQLCDRFYKGKALKENLDYYKSIRYQLLHYLAGSLTEGKKCDGVVFMPIFVYGKTSDKSGINQLDFKKFVESLNFECVNQEDSLYRGRIEDVEILIGYCKIGEV
jgi:hypothetical protein